MFAPLYLQHLANVHQLAMFHRRRVITLHWIGSHLFQRAHPAQFPVFDAMLRRGREELNTFFRINLTRLQNNFKEQAAKARKARKEAKRLAKRKAVGRKDKARLHCVEAAIAKILNWRLQMEKEARKQAALQASKARKQAKRRAERQAKRQTERDARHQAMHAERAERIQALIAQAWIYKSNDNLDMFERIFPLIDGEMDGGYPVTRAYFFEYRDDSDA